MVALPAITGTTICLYNFVIITIFTVFYITACLYGDLGSDDFVNALQQAKYLDVLVDFKKDDWLHLLKQ
jgi:hypothetical protein